ncbi:MAG: family 16 glycoside hydrolase [Thermoguttaceae bacterium]
MNQRGIQLLAWCLGVAMGLAVASVQAESPAADSEGFHLLFDGKTLDGWDGDPNFWRVEDGCITGQTTKENPAPRNTFLIWRGGKPADFQLKIEFRMPNPGFANSGVQIRSWEGPQKWQVSGYQPDMDSDDNYTGTCYGENFRGGLAGRGEKTVIGKDGKRKVEHFGDAAELAKFIKNRGWNEYDITALGNHIIEKINGRLMCEVVDEDTVARKDGILALQIHAGPPMKVQFRNVRFKEFKRDDTANSDAKKKIVFIAGGPSHGYAQHEHHAGCLLLAKCIQENVPEAETVVYQGWPKDPQVLDEAATVVIFCDGGDGHLVMSHLDEFDKLARKGVGLVCIHYAVEVPKGRAGDLMKNWIGGYFETFWSVNPDWTAHYKGFPDHPVARGVRPFTVNDEWYYHMRFQDDMKGVTPILTAVPPDEVHRPGNDAHGANPHVFARKGMPEHMAWAYERPGGGRGFGLTGAHYHWNWGCDSFRTVVLNGIVWTAGLEVPTGGVPSKTPTFADLQQNLDKPQPRDFNVEEVKQKLGGFNK